MFVDDKTVIVYSKWPSCLVNKNGKYLKFPVNNSYTYSNFSKINKDLISVLIVNPSITELLKICVYLRDTCWKGNITILFECDNKPPPFRLVNDN
ncbi:107L [Yaba monkey tumor virus]|uniref:107L n=1 Tax=Yaba monkey tumor virus (strain VR587) TaxID=928314 RepID=Q6TUR2_YMTV5|nr:107L [Yaba monkey tumor virus]AAR07463.1 107L [Yaba monkey tumor virus]